MKKPSKDFCGIVFIGGGSSWAYAGSPKEAAQLAGKCCKADWKSLFKFAAKQNFTVNVFDMKTRKGWYADHRGVFDSTTKKRIPVLEVVAVVV